MPANIKSAAGPEKVFRGLLYSTGVEKPLLSKSDTGLRLLANCGKKWINSLH